jgi:hypothetical protein
VGIKKSPPPKHGLFSAHGNESYAALIALTGQVLSQVPQSVQVSGSITYLLSPALIASTGHTLSQAPHIVQSFEII